MTGNIRYRLVQRTFAPCNFGDGCYPQHAP